MLGRGAADGATAVRKRLRSIALYCVFQKGARRKGASRTAPMEHHLGQERGVAGASQGDGAEHERSVLHADLGMRRRDMLAIHIETHGTSGREHMLRPRPRFCAQRYEVQN